MLKISFSIFHRARPPPHDLAGVVWGDGKIRDPTELIDSLIIYLPVLQGIDQQVLIRLIESYPVVESKILELTRADFMGDLPGSSSFHLPVNLLKEKGVIPLA